MGRQPDRGTLRMLSRGSKISLDGAVICDFSRSQSGVISCWHLQAHLPRRGAHCGEGVGEAADRRRLAVLIDVTHAPRAAAQVAEQLYALLPAALLAVVRPELEAQQLRGQKRRLSTRLTVCKSGSGGSGRLCHAYRGRPLLCSINEAVLCVLLGEGRRSGNRAHSRQVQTDC